MSNVNWTNEQKEAIYKKGSNILVAAAAGSGKTAVLVERIINKIINENVDIDKLLIVTFTNAAASEMKQRILDAIYKKLDENPDNENLQRQILLINKASICTIDAFCLEVVKNNFFELNNVSPNFRIADTTEIDILEQEVIEEIFENKYEEQNEDFIQLINTYTSYKDDTPLKNLIIDIYKTIQSMPFPKEWLNEHIEMFNLKGKIENDFSQTQWGKILLEDIEEELIDDINILKGALQKVSENEELEKIQEVLKQDIVNLQILKSNLNNWDNAFNVFNSFGNNMFKKWPRIKESSELKENIKSIRDNVKKKFKDKLGKILICDSKQSNIDIYDMYDILKKLENLIMEFSEEFSKKKQEKNIVDFSDVEHFALQILLTKDDEGKLVKSNVAKMYSNKFVEIAIDEYQDSNLVQEYIMTSISNGNNIFMVGDVKQSIYKFRQAMPELFLNKYNKYKSEYEENNGLKIKLFKNFRSRKNVLDFTNLIFQNIMSDKLGDVNYTEEEYLNLGAEDYQETKEDLKTQINIINLKDNSDEQEETIEEIELEARFVAKKIKELIQTKYQVYDRKKECFRDIKYSDIAVLLRSTKNKANIFEQEIINEGMPVFSDTSQEYLDSIEIQTIISLLKIIDNPMQDIPLVTVLRSNIGKFTDDDLVNIRLNDNKDSFYICMLKAKINAEESLKNKIEIFLDNLSQWREEQEYLALDELIWKIYTDTGFYNYCGLMPNGVLRQANLKALFERAKQYETASFKGLYNFINFIDKLRLGSGDLGSAKLIGENDDVIRIMSIHKSKGLEFPIVFLSNVGKQFNMQNIKNDPILIHSDLGIGMKYINYETQVEYDTNAKTAVKNRLTIEGLSEEMRVLYVALTRAKEKIIITGVSKDFEKEFDNIKEQSNIYEKENEKINHILLKKCKSYLEWILLVYMYNTNDTNKIAELNVIPKSELASIQNDDKTAGIDVIKELNNFKYTKEQMEELKKEIEYEYKYKQATLIPTKTSVSEIKKIKGQKESEEVNLLTPKFMEKADLPITAGRKGTLMHMCMQKLEPKNVYTKEKITKIVDEMYIKKIITEKEKNTINIDKILKFTNSPIWLEMKEAKSLYQEKPFYIELLAKDVYNEQTDDKILVQGIIDLYYINKKDELVLVDYKTDYVQNEIELIEKYITQLKIYKKALEFSLNKNVDKTYIYSIYLDKEIKVDI